MNVLGIDGAIGAFSVGVASGDEIVTQTSLERTVALEAGLEAIANALRTAAIEPAQLERIAVGVGPGGFTGLRIAIAYAKSLAQAWRLPLVGISSFDLLEYGRDLPRVLTVVCARPGVISARYRDPSGHWRSSGLLEEVLGALHADARAGMLPVIGAAKDVLDALGERGIDVQPLDPRIPFAGSAAALAAPAIPPAPTLHEVRADYGERPAAEIPKRR